MYHSTGSEFIANAILIRLNAERGAQLEELGKQTNILAKGFKQRTREETAEAMGKDNEPTADS